MRLLKVIIRNIKKHEYLEFEPAESGSTAICGTNGAGKTTVLNAFAWSLFGTKQQNAKTKNFIRYGVNPKTDYVGVQSFIVVGNREYKIERRIMSEGSAMCHIYSRPVGSEEDYKLDSGPSVSHAEGFIRQLLRMDDKGFYTASFIQQKQVDQIILASPKERSQIIEKMIGISAITTAIQTAKDDSRALQKALSIIRTGSVEEQKQQVEDAKRQVLQLKHELEQATNRFQEQKQALDKQATVYQEEQVKQQQKNDLEQEIKLVQQNNKSFDERLVNQMNLYKQLGETKQAFSEAKLKVAEEQEEQAKQEVIHARKTLTETDYQLQELDKLFAERLTKNAEEEYRQVDNLHKQTIQELQEKEMTYSIATKEKEQIKAFLLALEDGSATCPYCQHPIVDREQELKEHTRQLQEKEKEVKSLAKVISALRKQATSQLQEAMAKSVLYEQYCLQNEKEPTYKALQKEQAKLIHDIATKERLYEKAQDKASKLRKQKENAELIASVRATIQTLQMNREQNTATEKRLQDELSKIQAISTTEFKQVEDVYNQLTKEVHSIEIDLVTLSKDLENAKQLGKQYLEQLKASVEAQQEHALISQQLTIKNLSIQALTDFKEARAKESIKPLSALATELLAQFTAGRFTEVLLDETFDIYVRNKEGNIQSLQDLSGGETSAVAIALRLAISLFLGQGSTSLLILDEALVSMDDERQQLILEAITSLPNSQVIIIAHSNVIHSFVDKTMNLEQ